MREENRHEVPFPGPHSWPAGSSADQLRLSLLVYRAYESSNISGASHWVEIYS